MSEPCQVDYNQPVVYGYSLLAAQRSVCANEDAGASGDLDIA